MFEIRQAVLADRDVVVRLWMELLRSQSEYDGRFGPSDDAEIRWRNDFPEWLDRQGRRLFVAEVDDRVCGFITAERWSPAPVYRASAEVFIDEIFVEPAVRRQGIATGLVGAVHEWAESLGAARLRAGMLAANDPGRAFWSGVGAEPISVTFGIELTPETEADSSSAVRGRLGF